MLRFFNLARRVLTECKLMFKSKTLKACLDIKDMEALRLNCKNFGYQIGRDLQPKLQTIDISNAPQPHGLISKPTTQADIESSWFVYWCQQINSAPIYHRKLWEFAFLLQALFEQNMLRERVRGIGFGCGEEPLASVFAARGMDITVSDLSPEQVHGKGWVETGQHTTTKDLAYFEDIVSRDIFERNVKHKYIDMNEIPEIEDKFDFCWSVCAMEHLGSIEKGLDFVEKSLSVLKPGGVAVHTTEFNYLYDKETVDFDDTVLFRKTDFTRLAANLAKSGHTLLGPDFNVGSNVLDRFIDIPPYAIGTDLLPEEQWGDFNDTTHLKLSIHGFPCTCYGLIVIKSDR